MKQKKIKNNKYEIFGENGWEDFEGVIKTTDDNIPVLNIKCENGANITCTMNHKICNGKEYIKAKYMSINDYIKTNEGLTKITKITKENRNEVYDIWNSDSHHVFSCASDDENAMVLTHQCDEFAFVPGGQAEEFWASNYPTISASKNSKIIIISTPNGMFNIFHRIYTQAERNENTFKHTKVTWREVPGRDNEWAEEQKKNLGMQKFNQEFAVEFLGSTNIVINSEVLEVLLSSWEDPIEEDLGGKLKIYEKPKDGAKYVIGVDTGKGTGENSSVATVIRIDSIVPVKMKQVAIYRDNLTDIYKFTELIDRLCYYYNNSYIMAENNSEGAAVINRLWWDFENENLVNTGSKAVNLGIRASRTTKPKAVLLMKRIIEDGSIRLPDRTTVEELSSFIEEKEKFFGKDKPDDCVSALYWAIYLLEMNILDERYEFVEKKEDDVWGILTDIEKDIEEWDWLLDSNVYD